MTILTYTNLQPHVTLEQCQLTYIQETWFHCRSVDYAKSTYTCNLNSFTTEDYPLEDSYDEDYYEIAECLEGPPTRGQWSGMKR